MERDKLIEVVERLIIDVAANRLILGLLAAASPDGLQMLKYFAGVIDEATLPMSISEAEREGVKAILEHVIEQADAMQTAMRSGDA